MNHFKQFDSSAWVLFKQTTFSYDTFRENQLPIEDMFTTRFLLTEWKECLLKNSLYNPWQDWKNKLEHIFNKKLTVYP